MKTLLVLIISVTLSTTPCQTIQKVETTQTGALITYTDGTGLYIGK